MKAKASIVQTGEIHFTQADVELRNSMSVVAVNGPNKDSATLYWNDTPLRTEERDCTTPVLDGRAGIDSSNGVHGWTCSNNSNGGTAGSWGDVRFIDDWTFASANAVTEVNIPGSITVVKTADPLTVDEPGGSVLFTVAVHNNDPVENVTLQSLTDNPYGDVTAIAGNVTDTTCAVPQTIAANGTYACSFHAKVTGDATNAVTDVVTASARDVRGNTVTAADDATVTVVDVKPKVVVDKSVSPGKVAAPGGPVTFTVGVTNPSLEPVTLTALVDDKFGPLGGKGSCTLPQTIAPAGRYSCAFTESVTGDAGGSHVDTVTGTARDNENNEVTDEASATVDFLDKLPKIVVDMAAGPNELPESGGTVTYTVVVTNPLGAPGPIVVTTLTDTKFGNLDGMGSCDLSPPVVIAPGDDYTCAFQKDLAGNAKDIHVNTVAATAVDDDGNKVSASDDAAVTFTEVEKTARPTAVPEPDGHGNTTVLPGSEEKPTQPGTLRRIASLPATGGRVGSLAAYGLALVAVGTVLRRRRPRS
jgi:hypothetical protein